MITKISDFKLAEYLIRNLCKRCNVHFVDIPVDFSETPGTTGQKISVKDDGRLSKTLFQIVTSYLQGMEIICGTKNDMTNEEKTAYITYVASVLRELSYAKDAFPEAFTDKPALLYANRQPLVWIALRDIICPAMNIPLKNIKVLAAKSGRIDAARFISADDAGPNTKEPYIFLNGEIENQGVRSAYLIYACLEAFGVDATGTLNHILSRDELWKKVMGLAQMSMVETDLVNDFIMTLSILADYSDIDSALEKKKTAKWHKRGLWSQAQAANLWWQLGLIEKMLEPDRGPDWTGYFITKPFIDDLWDRVEAEKKKRGLKELPMELLLRVQSEEFKLKPDLTIQGLLADDRVW